MNKSIDRKKRSVDNVRTKCGARGKTSKMIHVDFQVKLPYVLKKRDDHWLSICPVLDVYSQGSSKQEAKKSLGEAIKLFLISCFEHGTLEQVLRECGFKLEKDAKARPSKSASDYITVPLPMAASGRCAQECHA